MHGKCLILLLYAFFEELSVGGKGYRRLPTLIGGAFSMQASGSASRARATSFLPAVGQSVFLEWGAGTESFGFSLPSGGGASSIYTS